MQLLWYRVRYGLWHLWTASHIYKYHSFNTYSNDVFHGMQMIHDASNSACSYNAMQHELSFISGPGLIAACAAACLVLHACAW
jgi:hypothetical protein